MNESPPPPPVDPRIYLAAERTLLAWIRTGIALMGFGLVVAKLRLFLHELLAIRGQPAAVQDSPGGESGVLLLVLGAAVIGAAALRHRRYLGQLARSGTDAPAPRRFPLFLAALIAAVGLALAYQVARSVRTLPTMEPAALPARP